MNAALKRMAPVLALAFFKVVITSIPMHWSGFEGAVIVLLCFIYAEITVPRRGAL